MLARLVAFLRTAVIMALPSGITSDGGSGAWGYFAMLANLNAYSQRLVTIATTSANATVLTAAQAIAGSIRLTAGANAGFTITLPSTVALLAALGPAIPVDGTFTKVINILNDGIGQTGTLTAGDASTTITGTATIGTNTRRQFTLTVTAAGAITFQNFGSQAI